ncbi:MAG: sensor N-terminal transmembrane domain-containing protein [Rhodobacteraceae bacterium]|nr:sensor N-terminal transmembrane domain-containing protein [Paracoccaceae bacterium]
MSVAAPAQRGGRDEEQPVVVIGEDWTAAASRRESSEEAREWFRVQSSPLARKIITFNLLALLVLVAGVLYLNPFRDSLVDMRERALTIETRLIARVLEAGVASDARAVAGDRAELLARIDLPPGTEVFVFDPEGSLVASSVGMARSTLPGLAQRPPEGTVITDAFNRLWEMAAGLFDWGGGATPMIRQEDQARAVIDRALAGGTPTLTARNENRDLVFAVATPIRRDGQTLGAVALTTVGGEIDQIVRIEREQVLQMFLIAILVSIGLSLVLASTIANPLRDLAAAARAGRDPNARRMSPTRVRIPDLTSRPDEIGRLSGALRDMVAALYDRIESNEQFAADVAHEI